MERGSHGSRPASLCALPREKLPAVGLGLISTLQIDISAWLPAHGPQWSSGLCASLRKWSRVCRAWQAAPWPALAEGLLL